MPRGLPPGYGKANNPTGKGLIAGAQEGNSRAQRAGREISKMLIEAMMAGDKPKAQEMCTNIALAAAKAEEWAVKFVFDRIVGKQDTLAEALGEGRAAISRIEFVVVDPIDAGRNSPEITTTYTSQ